MISKFDECCIKYINEAKEYTLNNFHLSQLGTESFLPVMFNDSDSICRVLLDDYRVNIEEIESIVKEYIIIRTSKKEYTEKLIEVFEYAETIAKENNSKYILDEHLFFALLSVRDTIFLDIIRKLNLNAEGLLDDLKEFFALDDTLNIKEYAIDLTALAKDKKLNNLIGREEYINKMKISLSRKNKNNILLVGSAGVGKTALVEGLAYNFIKEGVDKRIISLNISSIIANTKYRGDFEARINNIINEIILKKNVIVFIDEVHTIIGAGSTDNSLDVSNVLKPYLARGDFSCIGATTIEEYQKSIVKDKALARRFNVIFINEPTLDETIKILLGIKEDYEKFHQVKLDNKYCYYIAKIAENKMANKKFPDKAIDLMDETMSVTKAKKEIIVKKEDIDTALNNLAGINDGDLSYDYKYKELEPFFIDNFLGVKNQRLVSILFSGTKKALQELVFELQKGFGITKEMVLEINAKEYKESFSISTLLGSPPGYVGYQEGGILSEHFAKYPYQILVVKNLNFANHVISSLFNSLLLEGKFLDKKGREFSCYNTAFIFVNEEEKKRNNFGFIQTNKVSKTNYYDLEITALDKTEDVYNYSELFKENEISVEYDFLDYKKNPLIYKKEFLHILRNKDKKKFVIKYDENNELKTQYLD